MRICIVSPRHISYNPRVVKEADCLQAAGCEVTVVAICSHPVQAVLDEGIMASRRWRLLAFDYRREGKSRWNWLKTGVRQKLAFFLSHRCRWRAIIERAAVRELVELARLAGGVPADLYLAHHAEALPVVWKAARRNGARIGFDAEDFHTGMDGRRVPKQVWAAGGTADEAVARILSWHGMLPQTVKQRNLEWLERRYLPDCVSITAASRLIGIAYKQKYALAAEPLVIDNAFPWEAEEQLLAARAGDDEGGEIIRLYWYSQVIGPGRGLEAAVLALGMLPRGVQLHLRGDAEPAYREKLLRLAKESGGADRIHFLPIAAPGELVQEAARFDIGLALETDVEVNRLLCLTNKIFTFLNAGIPFVATATPAQNELVRHMQAMCALCQPDDPGSLAAAVRDIAARRQGAGREVMRRAARRAAEPFSWEVMQRRLLQGVTGFRRGDGVQGVANQVPQNL